MMKRSPFGEIGLAAEDIVGRAEGDAAPERRADLAALDHRGNGPDRALPAKILMHHQRRRRRSRRPRPSRAASCSDKAKGFWQMTATP